MNNSPVNIGFSNDTRYSKNVTDLSRHELLLWNNVHNSVSD